jgi:hypothetical protein
MAIFVELNEIPIHQSDETAARANKGRCDGSSERTHANHEHARSGQALLAL